MVTDNATHLIAALSVRKGPSNDGPDLIPAVRQAVVHLPIATLLGDGGFDAEKNHRVCRQELGIRRTVIAVNTRGAKSPPPTPYRRSMATRFPRTVYRQRWQVESVFSRLKRRLGSALRARGEDTRYAECCVRVITHDIMIL
jgi:hypothetical protein